MHDVTPEVFASQSIESQVWGQKLLFERGRSYLLRAESGSGKSSLCSYIMGYRSDYRGEIRFDEEPIMHYAKERFYQLRQGALSYVPQGVMLFNELNALENIELKNSLTHHKSREWIISALNSLGLGGKLSRPAAKLSFGERQRVAIVRALCQPFDFIILDEPTSHIDDQRAAAVASLIKEELSQCGGSLIAMSIGKELDIDYTLQLNM